ncbi:MAG: hypothetical protein HY701_09910 [Gemmatimonadetes bacterium]|nr:hypothetical protein [Gemmatimonadota bacterium]
MRVAFAVGRIRQGGAEVVLVREGKRRWRLPGPWAVVAVIVRRSQATRSQWSRKVGVAERFKIC